MIITKTKLSGKTRKEHDLIGDKEVPVEYLFGVQTLRGVENFHLSGIPLMHYPELVKGLAITKQAAVRANQELGLIDDKIANAIFDAAQEIIDGKHHDHFVVDMIQGGAGTSTNMNANEVIANRALEMLGHKRGEYKIIHPNNHVNMAQSTNDAYPTGVKVGIVNSTPTVLEELTNLANAFKAKAKEFKNVLKMGRTHLQDAVPMTVGQELEAFASILLDEVKRLEADSKMLFTINMGATAIGTGINSDPDYTPLCVKYLNQITGQKYVAASNMVAATSDTSAFVTYSAALKRIAIKLSKMCNDMRLTSSGPRAGLHEINLPPKQPGSTIMPGKVNPVIAEATNQVAFKIIGNDLTVTMASEAAQLQLNVMEPVLVYSVYESISLIINAMKMLRVELVEGITVNKEHLNHMVHNSIGLITALNPHIGYDASTELAAAATKTGGSVYDLALEKKLLSKAELDDILKPENMVKPRKITKKS